MGEGREGGGKEGMGMLGISSLIKGFWGINVYLYFVYTINVKNILRFYLISCLCSLQIVIFFPPVGVYNFSALVLGLVFSLIFFDILFQWVSVLFPLVFRIVPHYH